jgi:pyruvate-ferredoxin/flavodoxin oxidoreductase
VSPVWAKYYIKENNIRFYGVDTIRIAQESCKSDDSLVQRFQGIVLLGVFLRLTPFQHDAGLSEDELFDRVRKPIEKYFGRRGESVVQDNLEAARKGYQQVLEVPREVIDATPADVLAKGRAEWEAKGKDTNAFFI